MEHSFAICPNCHHVREDLKHYVLFETVIFLVFAVSVKTDWHSCCSPCMRQLILKKTFNSNILTAWALWVMMILPWHLIAYLLTYTAGHSKTFEEVPDQSEQAEQALNDSSTLKTETHD